MENIKPFLGKYNDQPVFLNKGKFGYYLNLNKKLYSVPGCFESPTFSIKEATKIIEFKEKRDSEKTKNVATNTNNNNNATVVKAC